MNIYRFNSLISKITKPLIYTFVIIGITSVNAQKSANKVLKFPINGAINVNPDTYFQLTFNASPKLHNKGKIRIYDSSNNSLVDELDLSISPGPKNTRTLAPYDQFIYANLPDSLYTVNKSDMDTSHIYQINHIGGTTDVDAYHFYPVIMEGNSVKIYPHNNRLTYNKTYYLVIDDGIFTLENNQSFQINKKEWQFQTKKTPPIKDTKNLIVSADGHSDFTTVQGAIDFIPENNSNPVTISIKNGDYNEIINCRNRKAISFLGENRSKVIIKYANNGVFNMRKLSADPKLTKNEIQHSPRIIMAVYNCSDITISNLTLQSIGEKPAQAEALLVTGDKIIVDNVSIEGSGDALQATGRIYINHSKIQGYGDNVLGYGAVFFNNCEFVSTFGPHLWVRNTKENHGNVLVNCTLRTIGGIETDIARAPDSQGKKYPFVEAVLIDCKVAGLRPSGWGKVTDVTENIKYWEYNTTSLETGKPVDVSQRNPASKQLTIEKDSELINNYRKPSYILDGWNP